MHTVPTSRSPNTIVSTVCANVSVIFMIVLNLCSSANTKCANMIPAQKFMIPQYLGSKCFWFCHPKHVWELHLNIWWDTGQQLISSGLDLECILWQSSYIFLDLMDFGAICYRLYVILWLSLVFIWIHIKANNYIRNCEYGQPFTRLEKYFLLSSL